MLLVSPILRWLRLSMLWWTLIGKVRILVLNWGVSLLTALVLNSSNYWTHWLDFNTASNSIQSTLVPIFLKCNMLNSLKTANGWNLGNNWPSWVLSLSKLITLRITSSFCIHTSSLGHLILILLLLLLLLLPTTHLLFFLSSYYCLLLTPNSSYILRLELYHRVVLTSIVAIVKQRSASCWKARVSWTYWSYTSSTLNWRNSYSVQCSLNTRWWTSPYWSCLGLFILLRFDLSVGCSCVFQIIWRFYLVYLLLFLLSHSLLLEVFSLCLGIYSSTPIITSLRSIVRISVRFSVELSL